MSEIGALPPTPDTSAVDVLLTKNLHDIGIPPCPDMLGKILEEAHKEEPDYARLTRLVSADVSVAAGLIKTANSPFFGMHIRVRSVKEALIMLGLDISRRAIAGVILRKLFPDTPSLRRFWDASARIARLSGWLAQELQLPNLAAEDAYTFGLFRDCGIPILLQRFPDYAEVLNVANKDAQHSFTSVEESVLPTNHAMVGCLLAQSWWLPEELCLAIRNHHDTETLSSAESMLPAMSRHLIAVSQLAEHLLQHLLGLSQTREWEKLGHACMQLLNLSEENLEQLYQGARTVAEATE